MFKDAARYGTGYSMNGRHISAAKLLKKRGPISARREREWRGRYLKRFFGDQRERCENWAWLVKKVGLKAATQCRRGWVWEKYNGSN